MKARWHKGIAATAALAALALGLAEDASAERPQTRELRQFVDADGVPTLTNRPEKYRAQHGFREVDITYQRITVPRAYAQPRDPKAYTTTAIATLITRYARQHGLDENLVYAVMQAESNFNPNAVSPAGACGLMQLMPGTAAEMGVTSIFDPAQNIAGGTQYLAKMLELFDNNVSLALAGYNAGPYAVKRHGGIPPYAETHNYVRKVLSNWKRFQGSGPPARAMQLARVQSAPARPGQPAIAQGQVVVHFKSGLTQPADRVEDQDPYYYIHYGRRTYPVRKELVARIE